MSDKYARDMAMAARLEPLQIPLEFEPPPRFQWDLTKRKLPEPLRWVTGPMEFAPLKVWACGYYGTDEQHRAHHARRGR